MKLSYRPPPPSWSQPGTRPRRASITAAAPCPRRRLSLRPLLATALLAALLPGRPDGLQAAGVLVPVASTTNVPVRIIAANLNGSSQTYEPFALRILQGLKPDIVAIQEFNYLNNTAADFRQFLDTAFGTNFSYFRESGYGIPNGIISRWPIRRSGSWVDSDPGVNDRGFAWAEVDLPGPEDLLVVSIHLKASDGASNILRRANQSLELKNLIQANFPSRAYRAVAGDCNIFSPTEPAMDTFRSYLTDDPIPTDAQTPGTGNPNTNAGRNRRYDYVFPSPALNTNRADTVYGTNRFPSGLVFDSRVWATTANLADVAPVQAPDSGLAQHMAVVKDFRIPVTVTNLVPVPAPFVRWDSATTLAWDGFPGLTYTIEDSISLSNWTTIGTATAGPTPEPGKTTTPVFFSLPASSAQETRFFRVRYP